MEFTVILSLHSKYNLLVDAISGEYVADASSRSCVSAPGYETPPEAPLMRRTYARNYRK